MISRFVAGLSLLVAATPALAQDTRPLGERLYDVVVSGLPHTYPGYRANHAKGGVFEGSFTASPEAASLSVSEHFQGKAVPMVIRYSNAGGIPDAADNAPSAAIRAMAFTFNLPDGASTDLMCINMPVFVVRTPEEFITFNKAAQASGPGVAQPTPVAQYIASHPETKAFITTPKPMPVSYGTQDYYAIHAYRLVNAAGEGHFVRFHVVPEAGRAFVSPEQAAAAAPNVLLDEMRGRVAKGPVAYHLMAQIAEPGDVTNDSTVSWPESRKVVDLGTITVTKAVADSATVEKKLGFLPNKVVAGLEISDDPFLQARAEAYGVAYPKRQ